MMAMAKRITILTLSTLLLACLVSLVLQICIVVLWNRTETSSFSFWRPNFNNTNTNDDRVATFYNLYIPNQGVEDAIRIIEEQIGQIGQSKNAKLYYNTIGQRPLNNNVMQSLCLQNHLHCIHLQHYDNAFEEVTLQALYEYCQSHTSHRVIYLHSKGTYHPTPGAERWRRAMTQAAVHPDCLIQKVCNVCGLTFSPLWTPMFPGNMWTAQCSYIQKLIAPREFQHRMQAFMDSIVQPRLNNQQLVANLYNSSKPDHVGLQRWAMEVWVGSHPSILPCDLSNPPFYQRAKNTTFQWSLAPRTTIQQPVFHLNDKAKHAVLQNESLRHYEFFLLPGLLLKWEYLYQTLPADSSWIWSWFPDGRKWQQQYNDALK